MTTNDLTKPELRNLRRAKFIEVKLSSQKEELVKVQFLEDLGKFVWKDGKILGPFKKGDIVKIPKALANVFVKFNVAKIVNNKRLIVMIKDLSYGIYFKGRKYGPFKKGDILNVEEELANYLMGEGIAVKLPINHC